MSDLVEPSTTEAAMRKAAMSLPPSDFGSHRAIQAAARAADDLIASYRARIEALEADADMVDEREMRSNLRIEALEAALDACIGAMGEGGSCSIIQWTDALSNARAARAALITEGGGDE